MDVETSKIHNYIIESTKKSTKNALIENLLKRPLQLEFKKIVQKIQSV